MIVTWHISGRTNIESSLIGPKDKISDRWEITKLPKYNEIQGSTISQSLTLIVKFWLLTKKTQKSEKCTNRT